MKNARLSLVILILVCVFALTACNGEKPSDTSPESPSTGNTGGSSPDVSDTSSGVTDDVPPAAEIDNSETEVRAIYQEYNGADIVEILQFSYDGQQEAFEEYNWRNPELELMNNVISTGPLRSYQEFLDGQIEDAESIDIRSYAFDKFDLLQIVTTCIVFPETQPTQYTKLWSYNFSLADNRWIQLEDVLTDYHLTAADIEQKFMELYTPSDGETVLSVNTAGFLINRMPAKPVTHFLLEVTLEFSSDPVVSFFMYTPDLEELEELDASAMFSPDVYGMAELEPPLMYAGGGAGG